MMYDDKEFIGKVIRNARKKAGLRQSQLSEMINMCDKNLGNIENGKQFPQVNNFLRLIEVLELSLEDFGVKKSSLSIDNTKEELFKLINSCSSAQAELYLQAIKFTNNILSNK